MTVALVYVHVARPEAADEFNAEARRFISTYKEFPAGCQHDLIIVFCNGKPTPEMIEIYEGLTPRNIFYVGQGRDIGAQQFAALELEHDFIVCANSRSFFHKAGWLSRLVECRLAHGPGIYSVMASYEGCPLGQVWPNPHLRTAFYGMDRKLWREFPHTINSREDSFRFESGEWNISNWCLDNEYRALLVSWGGCWEKHEWRLVPNGFRSGDQSNCMVFDRHTTIFFALPPPVQAQLERLANGTP